MPQPFLSVIIPAHNEESRLPKTFQLLEDFFKTQPYETEILVIENGSSDQTVPLVRTYAHTHPRIRLIEEKKRGKGLAVKRGLQESLGQYILITDADLSTPISEIRKFLSPTTKETDIIIGSREIAGSKRYNEPVHRHFMGRAFNRFVKLFVLKGFEDTQCGFKWLKNRSAKIVAQKLTLGSMAFDVELLVIAAAQKLEVKEIPIDWYCDRNSRVKIMSDTYQMIRDLWTIKKNERTGKYQ